MNQYSPRSTSPHDDSSISAMSNPEKLKLEKAFNIEFGEPIEFLSFS